MARPVPLLAGLAAGFALLRALNARRRAQAAEAPDTRAEELRRKLDEVKGIESEREAEEAGEIPIDRAEPLGDLDARRRRVHERGHEAAEQMRPPEPEA